MELEDFKKSWNQPEQAGFDFSRSQLKGYTVIDRLVRAQIIQFGKVVLIALGVVTMGVLFLRSSQTEGYLAVFIMIIACLILTTPLCLIFRRSIRILKSLEVGTSVIDSLQNYRHRIEAELKIQKLIMVFVIMMLFGFSFIVPSQSENGFEIASAVGIYTLVLLTYSYRNFEGKLKKELTKLFFQFNSSEDLN